MDDDDRFLSESERAALSDSVRDAIRAGRQAQRCKPPPWFRRPQVLLFVLALLLLGAASGLAVNTADRALTCQNEALSYRNKPQESDNAAVSAAIAALQRNSQSIEHLFSNPLGSLNQKFAIYKFKQENEHLGRVLAAAQTQLAADQKIRNRHPLGRCA